MNNENVKKNKNTESSHMRGRILFCISVVLLMMAMPFLPVHGEEKVYDNTLRLHVLANSDSEEDQALKLKVRDAIVTEAAVLSERCNNKEEAEKLYSSHLDDFADTAENVILENGYSYSVNVTLGKEYYPERQYENVRLPAGNYTSLKVNIGDAEGKNWWCVLFPPLCVKAASSDEELAAVGFTPNQVKVLTDSEKPQYVIRFRILEWAESLFSKTK